MRVGRVFFEVALEVFFFFFFFFLRKAQSKAEAMLRVPSFQEKLAS